MRLAYYANNMQINHLNIILISINISINLNYKLLFSAMIHLGNINFNCKLLLVVSEVPVYCFFLPISQVK